MAQTNSTSKSALRARAYRIKYAENVKLYEKLRQIKRRNDPVERAKKAVIDKNWSLKNKSRKAATNRAWRIANPKKVREWAKTYRLNHPERYRAMSQRYRATKVEGLERYGWIDERLIANYVTRVCGICGLVIEASYEIDHIIPLSRNGSHTLDNLQITHPVCNRTKSGKLQSEIELDIMILREYLK
jgi:5-methylcytosine-specific restriction endonuclease McrA